MALYGGIEIVGKPDLFNVQKLDLLPMRAIAEMEKVGMAIDREWFSQLSSQLTDEIRELRYKICQEIPPERLDEFIARANIDDDDEEQSGLPINLGSTQQLSKLLFEVLGIGAGRSLKRTKSGDQISTGKKQLEQFKRDHPIVPMVLDLKERTKLKSTYSDALPLMARHHLAGSCWCGDKHWYESYRIHTQILTTRTTTGRLASKAPNLQNIPARSELGRRVRGGFIPSKGMEMFAVDFGQFEMRLAAHYSQDTNLTRIFREGLDPHTDTAIRAFNKTKEEVESKLGKLLYRAPCKNLNFGVCLKTGSLIETNIGKIPIEKVTSDMLVWDGLEYVRHAGVIFKGFKEVITYAGITATPDHKIWTRSGRILPLATAMAQGLEIADGLTPSSTTRYPSDCFEPNPDYSRHSKRESSMYGMQSEGIYRGTESSGGHDQRMYMPPSVQISGQEKRGQEDYGSVSRNCAALYKSFIGILQGLWWPWNRESFQIRRGIYELCFQSASTSNIQGSGYRSDRQQWSLQAGKYSVRKTWNEPSQYEKECLDRLQRPESHGNRFSNDFEKRLSELQFGIHSNSPSSLFRSPMAGSSNESSTSQKGQIAPVYDILNAGPRKRFVADGKLVSNCYGLQAEGLYDLMLLTYATAGIPLPDNITLEWCEDFIEGWFDLYPGMRDYMETQYYRSRRYEIVWSLLGRVRRVPEVRSVHQRVVMAGLRQAGNMPIQGTQADLDKLSMAEVHEEVMCKFRSDSVPTSMLINVHDEIVGETEEGYGDMAVARMEEIMGNVMVDRENGRNMCRVPIEASGHTMTRWQK